MQCIVTMLPVVFVDGDQTIDLGTVTIQPSLGDSAPRRPRTSGAGIAGSAGGAANVAWVRLGRSVEHERAG